ncbi:hypothetical protein L596_024105 [Steinernema carpocapsae]|uniref:Uncharacterized protein n=1 Tax=Steinernema carpocapsae TaxID=34508 RepID=A0A4U5MFR6_STECR|nr:hypothetical protein L596_024105 [Steinernema carpocapsae]
MNRVPTVFSGAVLDRLDRETILAASTLSTSSIASSSLQIKETKKFFHVYFLTDGEGQLGTVFKQGDRCFSYEQVLEMGTRTFQIIKVVMTTIEYANTSWSSLADFEKILSFVESNLSPTATVSLKGQHLSGSRVDCALLTEFYNHFATSDRVSGFSLRYFAPGSLQFLQIALAQATCQKLNLHGWWPSQARQLCLRFMNEPNFREFWALESSSQVLFTFEEVYALMKHFANDVRFRNIDVQIMITGIPGRIPEEFIVKRQCPFRKLILRNEFDSKVWVTGEEEETNVFTISNGFCKCILQGKEWCELARFQIDH